MPSFNHIVITGASRGIGQALANYFRNAGAAVSSCGSNAASSDSLDLRRVDLRSRLAVEKWSAEVVAARGAPNLLINAAAIGMEHGPFPHSDLRTVEDLLNVNFAGTIRVVHAFLDSMITNGGGIIATLSTPPQGLPTRDILPYATSKFALIGFHQALVKAALPGITCVSVFPGIVKTDLTRASMGKAVERFPSPEEWVARGGPFFASLTPEHNGQHVTVPLR